MQNAKNLLWPLKGELPELEKEAALPTGSTGGHLKPSLQQICPWTSKRKPLPVPAVGVLHYPCSMLCLEVSPGFGSSAEQPLGLSVLEEGQRTRTLWTVRDLAAGTATKPPPPAQPDFLLPAAVFLGLWIDSGSPSRAIKGRVEPLLWLCLVGRSGWARLNPQVRKGAKPSTSVLILSRARSSQPTL